MYPVLGHKIDRLIQRARGEKSGEKNRISLCHRGIMLLSHLEKRVKISVYYFFNAPFWNRITFYYDNTNFGLPEIHSTLVHGSLGPPRLVHRMIVFLRSSSDPIRTAFDVRDESNLKTEG